MDLDLSSRRALVTGSTAGIGLAIAKALAQLGAEVAVNGRTGERIEQAIAILRREVPDGRFASAPGDVGTPEGAAKVIELFRTSIFWSTTPAWPRRRERGLAKAGDARVRRGMIQLAWRFLLFPKESALSQGYRASTLLSGAE